MLESQKYRQYAADCIRLSQTMTVQADIAGNCFRVGKARAGGRAPGKAQSVIASIDHALFFNSISAGFAECAAF